MIRSLVKLALMLPLVTAGSVSAQKDHAAPPARRTVVSAKVSTLDQRVETLAKYLALDEGQKAALRAILIQRQQDIYQMRRTPSSNGELLIDRARAIEVRTVEKIRAMLTEEQRKNYAPLAGRDSSTAWQNVSVEEWLKKAGNH